MQSVVCVVLVHVGFRRLVATISHAWVIQMIKQIRSSKDIKLNYDRQYAIKLESYVLYSA